MQGDAALALVAELHTRQRVMYAGGALEPVLELLAPEIVWHVPGRSPIAGEHRGHEGVAAYFERRRRLAQMTMTIQPGAAVAADGVVAQLVLGVATVRGERLSWQTAGVYRVEGGKVAEVWLVPADLAAFERIWAAR